MSEDPFDPEESGASAPPTTPLHIAGAGSFGMAVLLVSLSMLFIASMLAYLLIRAQLMSHMAARQWPPPGLPEPPATLWLSTVVIVICSLAIHVAVRAVRRDDQRMLRLWLRITFALGCLFLVFQTLNWLEFYFAIPSNVHIEGAYLGMFYTLTGLHAAHVIGGLVPLAIVTYKAGRGRYSRNFHPGIRYTATYWHFLDVVWLVLFTMLYL